MAVRVNTIATLGASALFGIIAVFLARGWIDGAIKSEFSNAENTAQPAIELVPVVVTDTALSFGDPLSAQALRVVDYPKNAVPDGAFASLDALFADPDHRVTALMRIAANEPVLSFKISGPDGRGAMSSLISEGMRAVSISVDGVNGVAGFVLPGDYVDVILTRNMDPTRREQKIVSDVLIQNLRVLAIDQNIDMQEQMASLSKTVTLEVTHKDAQKLNIGMDAGELGLILRRAGETDIAPVSRVSLAQLGTRQTKPRKAKSRRPAASGSAQVTIIRGDTRDEVNVVKDTADQNTYRAVGSNTELAGG